jgi:HPt (histidine-containing phosphotransfer) domain-containing protein
MGELLYINSQEGLARVANNEMLFKKLLGKFAASVKIEDFEKAINEKNFEVAGEIVHAAKGIAGNLSLTAFYDNSVILMDQLRGGGAPAQENVESFISLYYETVAAIEEYLG